MASIIQTSFATGEVSPTIYGRVDLAKYHVGAARLRNFFVDYRGGATSRPGTKFVSRVKTLGARLFQFQFNADQTYILEFGANYVRVIKDGEPVLNSGFALSAVTRGTTTVVTVPGHNFVVGDWLYFAGIAGTTQLNNATYVVGAISGNDITITKYNGAALNSSAWTAYVSGGTVYSVYTLATPYATSDLPLLKIVQSQDVLTLTHSNYSPRTLTRNDHNNWTLAALDFDAAITPPTTITVAGETLSGTPANNAFFSYCVTAIDGETGDESIASNVQTVESLNIGLQAGSITVTWNRVPGAIYYNVYKSQVSPGEDVPIGATYGYVGTAYGLKFSDGNIVPDFTKVPPLHRDPFAPGQITEVVPVDVGTGYSTAAVSTVTDPTGTGAVIKPVVVNNQVQAYIIVNGGKNYTNPSISTNNGSGATATITVGSNTGVYPSVSCYFQQRRIYAASNNRPQTLWASRPGSFNNMDITIPTLPDDALTLTLSASQVNSIKALQPMPGGLVVLTEAGAWQVSGGANGEPLTATSALATPQAYNGCSDVPPIPINFEILYVQSKGSTVRNLSYSFLNNIYTGTDLSVLANHLFVGYTIKEWAWAEEPFKLVWAVRSDGKLLCLTFLKEQEVFGWSWHDTSGLFKSIAIIREGDEDVPYFIVRRYINSEWVEYIERMASRHLRFAATEDAWCLDCGLELAYDEPNAAITISAASGNVTIVADNAVFTVGDVGRVIRAGNGVIDVTGYTNAATVTGLVRNEIGTLVGNTDIPTSFNAGEWNISTPVNQLSGLEHLEGQTVAVVADANYVGDFTVTNGQIVLDREASKIIAGLKYTCQLQTLPLDTGQPTIQGKRKKISALTVLVDKTRGIFIGHDWDSLYEVKEWSTDSALGSPIELFSGQRRVVMDPLWEVEGQICIEQRYPLPCTVLAVVPEVIPGDSGK